MVGLMSWFKRKPQTVPSQPAPAVVPERRRPFLPIGAEAVALIERLRASRLTYCGPPKLENIAAAIDVLKADGVEGAYLEAGVALGGSAILLGALCPKGTRLHLYDVFAMIPPPGENDGPDAHERYAEIHTGQSKGLGDDTYYGYVDDLQGLVRRNLEAYGLDVAGGSVELHKGLFEDTLHPSEDIALAHIDCDWYDSVRVCIDRIEPRLVRGGVMVFDDYSSYSGCKRAVDEMLLSRSDVEVLFQNRSIALRKRK